MEGSLSQGCNVRLAHLLRKLDIHSATPQQAFIQRQCLTYYAVRWENEAAELAHCGAVSVVGEDRTRADSRLQRRVAAAHFMHVMLSLEGALFRKDLDCDVFLHSCMSVAFR